MATFDYSDMLATADELLEEFGQSGTLKTPGAKTGDAHNPTIGAEGSVAITLVETDFDRRVIDNTSILATDKQLLVKVGGLSADIVPNATKVVYGGRTYQIVPPVRQINPAGTNLLWIIQARE